MADLFKKILKGVLIGGGTILSLLCPPAGGAVITAGMAIGTGAVALGSIIKTGTVDKVTDTVSNALANAGLLNPATVITGSATSGKAFVLSPIAWIAIIGAAILLIFKPFKHRR